ncbi:MAG: glycosyltransferase [bacterium]|nr:glycosyltransferase [bacterium]
MRILFIAPYLPSLIRVRSFNFIKALKKQGHSIYLVCLVQEKNELSETQEIEKYCEKVEKYYLLKYQSYLNCLLYLFTLVSLQSAYCFSKKMKKRVDELLKKEKFDLVHVEFIRGTYFLPEGNTLPSVFDSVDCVTNLYKQFSDANHSFFMRIIRYVEWFKLGHYEPKVAGRFDRVLVTTENEKQELKALNNKLPIEVIANGVDLEYFKPLENKIELFSIVMTGKMSYIANELAFIYFAEEIWPKVKTEIPQAKLYIVGNEPGPKVKKYESLDIIITGYVSDLRLYLSKANVVVAPIIAGGGIQNKILEAMSMAKPVVTTGKGAEGVEGLINGGQAQFTGRDSNICVADTSDEFATAVVNILKDAKLAENLGVKAREFVERYYDWGDKGKKLADIYINVLKEKSIG